MRKQLYKSKNIIALLLLVLFMPSCTDWLSLAPENALIKEKFWKKKEDADGALAAAYDALRDASLESLIWGELRADMITLSGSDFSAYASIQKSDISISNDKIKWEPYYKAINLANTFMYFGDEVVAADESFTPRMKEAYDAECLYIRALSYFYLVRLWKQVPLVLEASVSDQGNLFLGKSTEKEVLSQIIKDLLEAKELAYTDEFKDDPIFYKGRANKYSILALLADVYLWNEDYENVVKYTDEIIKTGKFELESFNDWFQLYNPGNSMKESIFEIQFDDALDQQDNPINDKLLPVNGTSKVRMNSITKDILFQDADQRYIGTRKPIWKYIGISANSSTKRDFTQRDANFIYYRYADVLLTKAEALIELGRLPEANGLIRLTAERAGLSHADIGDQDNLRVFLLNEKAREFALEGKRWFDVLRYGKRNNFKNKQYIIDMILASADDIKQAAVIKTRVVDTMSYYLPIPKGDILTNPNLEQNPFYDR